MTDITTEKARIGAPSAQPFIDGFTEEGESLSPAERRGVQGTAGRRRRQAPLARRRRRHPGQLPRRPPDLLQAGRLQAADRHGGGLAVHPAQAPPRPAHRRPQRRRPVRGRHRPGRASRSRPWAARTRRIGSAGIPEDRVSANAWENFTEATVITVPAEVQAEGEVSVVLTGQGTRGFRAAPRDRGGEVLQGRRRPGPPGHRRRLRKRRDRRRGGRAAHRHLAPGMERRRRARLLPAGQARPRRQVQAHRRQPRRRPRARHAVGPVHRPGCRSGTVRPVLRRRRPAP